MDKLSDRNKLKESLFFNRFDKVDWKHIASIDIQAMKKNMDWETIEKNVRNIICCHLETEFDRCNIDPNLKKLYQLAQVTIECLLHFQYKMSHELELCQEKLQTKKSVLGSVTKCKEEFEKQIKELKKENKKIANQSQFYRCPSCPKTFLNGDYLLGHWQRRHPEVWLRTSTPSNQQPLCQILHVSQPISTPVSPSAPVEFEELKIRLHVAEQQLQQEQQLLISINEKMEVADKNLQGILVQEVEKLRRDIFEQRTELVSTGNKNLETSSAQTSPRLTKSPSITAVNENPVKLDVVETTTKCENVSHQPTRPVTPPTPAVRTVIQPKLVKLVAEQPESTKEESDDPSISSLLDTDDEKEQPKVTRHSVICKPKVEIDRKILAERFKNVIKDTLSRRLLKLGLDTKKTSKINEDKLKEISHELKSNRPRTEEFTTLRKQLKKEMMATVQSGNKKPRRHRHQIKKSAPPKITPVPITPESPVSVASPIRAPIPAPRSKPPTNGPNLMARNGEAISVFIKPSIPKQEKLKMPATKERSPSPVLVVKPESPVPIREMPEKDPESDRKITSDPESDSFSFSSLDAILHELKRPKTPTSMASTSNPGTPSVKSVQWREPVETVAPLDDSWGI